jgi:glycosyltransferase involved in cell wall biosynthesis
MLKTIDNLSLQETVHYLADVNDKELKSLYRHATVFVMPSLMEGFGFPAVDAMSMGIPVIISDRGSLPEICGKAACLVDPLDIGGIANALQKVISDHSFRDALAQRSLERSKLFSWEETAKKTHSIYENVAG